MVCKEDVVSLFKDWVSYKRVDLMCTLLNMCLPFELRFLGTYLEELGKRDFTELRDAETRANNPSEVADAQSVSDKNTRRKLALYLSLLHSANYGCSNVLYKTLANFDATEIQSIVSNSEAPSNDDGNPLDELLLLYMLALNHPAFTYEQKSVFGSIFMKLQDEEARVAGSQKPAIMNMKATSVPRPPQPPYCQSFYWPPMLMPCMQSPDAASAGTNQHYVAAAPKPLLLASSGLANAGEGAKAMHMTEMPAPTYFQLTSYPNTGGHQAPNSVLFYSVPPPAIAQTAPATPSNPEYPQILMPSLPGDLPCAAAPVPSAANLDSPYRSPGGSPYSSPVPSRPGTPNWGGAAGVQGPYKATGPPRHGSSSSSSSSCSGASNGGYRTSRSSCSRHNGQPEDLQVAPDQQRPGEPQLHGMLANMTLANGVCSGSEAGRQEPKQYYRDDKHLWVNPTATDVNNSPGSSQSESPSPPRSPPQDDAWDQSKDDPARWEKMQTGGPPHVPMVCTQGGLPRVHNAMTSAMLRRPQELKGSVINRRPAPNTNMLVFSATQGMQQMRASPGAIFPTNTYLATGTGLFSSMLPQHPGYPAFTPNGIASPPPEIMYAQPSQTSPPPNYQATYPPKSNSPPYYQPSYPPPSLPTGAKLTCYNCGGSNHRGVDCAEPSIEEVMRRGQYRLDFSSPQSSMEQQQTGAPALSSAQVSTASSGNPNPSTSASHK